MTATLRDVAREAGVDISTASRALRGDGRMAEETRQRVMATAERLGYRANLAGQILRAGCTRVIHVLVPELDSPIDRMPASRAARLLRQHGYDTLVGVHHGDRDSYARQLDRLLQQAADGALVIPVCGHHGEVPALEELVAKRFPLVFIDRHPEHLAVPTVTTDNAAAVRDLIARLVDDGCRRLINVCHGGNPVADLRRETVFSGAHQAGLPVVDAYGPAREGFLPWLENTGTSPLGIIAISQHEIMVCVREHAERLRGTALSFAVFDDWAGEPYPAPQAHVAVQDLAGLAERAVDRLLAMLEDPIAWEATIDRVPIRELRTITAAV